MPEDSADQDLMFGNIAVSDMPESMWQMKPWWCQPWSIVLTGIFVPACSWLLLHRLLITLPVAAFMVGWWLLFLVIVPAQYAAAVKEAKANL
ncbi:MAG: DUF6737 family protein [Cyanobacteria bacterium P01_D01_bin.36]